MEYRISIIVPVFNTSKYLKECVDSILNQTYKNLEVILVDDGSTDNSWEICENYEEKDNRVRAFHKENSGVSATRNYGLEKASGDLISFCDSDDIVKQDLYETLLNKLIETGADRVCGGYAYLYSDNHKLYCKPRKKDGIYKCSDLVRIMIDDGTLSGFLFSGVNNSLFKSDILRRNNIKFKEDVKYNEDSLFSFEYAIYSKTLYSMQSVPLYLYRQHESSSTKKRPKEKVYDSLHIALDTIVDGNKDVFDYSMQMKRRAVTEALWAILDCIKCNSGRECIRAIRNLITSPDVTANLKYIDYNNLNIYKKCFFVMMKHRCPFFLYLAAAITPLLSKYLSR